MSSAALPSDEASSPPLRWPPGQRRRALRRLHANGVLWSIGNGLTSGTLVIYLAQELGARGLALSLVLAAPTLTGLLRLGSPLLIGLCGSAKATFLWFSLASYLLLFGVPTAVLWQSLPDGAGLALLVTLTCLHQLLEYIAAVAFWAWAADLTPRRIRGRFFGRRQAWQLAALIPTLLLSGLLADRWKAAFVDQPAWQLGGYALLYALGAAVLLTSLIPLATVRATRRAAPTPWAVRSIGAPLRDARYWRLLAFGIWLSTANGLTQSAQNIYPKAILKLGVFEISLLVAAMRLGQIVVSRAAGSFSDRYGIRPALIGCQSIVAMSMLFLLLATPEQPWWIAGAYLCWMGYAGLNVGLPNLMLKLSPAGQVAGYAAAYFALSSLSNAAATVGGGYLFDQLQGFMQHIGPLSLAGYELSHFRIFFIVGWIARLGAALWLLTIVEPGAWSWPAIWRRWRPQAPASEPPPAMIGEP